MLLFGRTPCTACGIQLTFGDEMTVEKRAKKCMIGSAHVEVCVV